MRPIATDVARSVVYVLGMRLSYRYAKTPEPIVSPFGRSTHAGPRNHAFIRWRSRSPTGRGRREGWQNGDAAFCQITLNTCYYYTTVRIIQITPTNHLLTALAIADLLTMVSYLPYAVYYYCITVPDPSYGHPAGWVVYLLFNIYFTITTHTAAMWLTVTLAVFRYVVVCCHQALGARLCTLERAKV